QNGMRNKEVAETLGRETETRYKRQAATSADSDAFRRSYGVTMGGQGVGGGAAVGGGAGIASVGAVPAISPDIRPGFALDLNARERLDENGSLSGVAAPGATDPATG